MSRETVETVGEREMLDGSLEESELDLAELERSLENDLSSGEKKMVAAIHSEHENQFTLRKMIESDAESDRKLRQLERTHSTYSLAHLASVVGAVGYDLFGGGNITELGMHNIATWPFFGGMMGSLAAKHEFKKEDLQNEFSEIAWREHYIIENKAAKELLNSSDIVIEDSQFGENQLSGERLAESYDEIVSAIKGSYEETLEDLEDLPEEYRESYFEEEIGLKAEELQRHTVTPVVRFSNTMAVEGVPDYNFRLEVYAGEELVAQYEGVTDWDMKSEVESRSKSFSRKYEEIAQEMNWEDIEEPLDQYDKNKLTGYIHDSAKSSYEGIMWIGSKVKTSIH